jgi:hypothetical protein
VSEPDKRHWLDRVFVEAAEAMDELPGWAKPVYTPPQALSLKQLANLMDVMPRVPKRELKCHPSVMAALGDASVPKTGFLPVNPSYLLGIDIFEDDTLIEGYWELHEDGRVVNFGVLGG